MPLISIKEVDNTTPTGAADNVDVVFVPGFVNVNAIENHDFLWAKDEKTGKEKYIGIEANKPELFTSLKQFETRCGVVGVKFDSNQYYSDLTSVDSEGETVGFSSKAIPFDGIMFHKDQVDPGYVMAKELLVAGLPVLFQRVNSDENYGAEIVGKEPEGFNDNPTDYQYKLTGYNKIVSPTIPTFGFVSADGTVYDESVQYYKLGNDAKKDEITKKVITPATHWTFTPVATTDIDDAEKGIHRAVSEGNVVIMDESIYTYGRKDYSGAWVSGDKIGEKYVKVGDEVTIKVTDGTTTPKFESGAYVKTSLVTGVGFEIVSESDWVDKLTCYKITPVGDPTLSGAKKSPFIKKSSDGVYSICISNDVTGEENWANSYTNYYYEEETWVDVTDSQATYDETKTYREVLSGTTIKDMYNSLGGIYEANGFGLDDRGNYSVKYLTSGGYPVYEYSKGAIVTRMMNLAAARGDCVALIDHTDNILRESNIDKPGNIYYEVLNDSGIRSLDETATYGAMFTPWAEYNRVSVDKDSSGKKLKDMKDQIRMPASFAYLMALADSIKTYANWLAIAGSARGTVPNLATGGMTTVIPNGIADRMIKDGGDDGGISINPITNIKPYGETIWGNRTLASNDDGLKATSFLNIRNLVSDIKKLVYKTCRRLTYEPNSEQLWVNIQAALSPTLDRMQSGYGISGYQLAIDKDNVHYGEKATFCFKIIIYPIYAVEKFYVTVYLEDDEVTISE